MNKLASKKGAWKMDSSWDILWDMAQFSTRHGHEVKIEWSNTVPGEILFINYKLFVHICSWAISNLSQLWCVSLCRLLGKLIVQVWHFCWKREKCWKPAFKHMRIWFQIREWEQGIFELNWILWDHKLNGSTEFETIS